jgi:hypothetical protein
MTLMTTSIQYRKVQNITFANNLHLPCFHGFSWTANSIVVRGRVRDKVLLQKMTAECCGNQRCYEKKM